MVPLNHLVRLTDGCGIWQHARHAVPNRRHGYCLDDAARALWLCARRARLDPSDPAPERLAAIYAAFTDQPLDELASNIGIVDVRRGGRDVVGRVQPSANGGFGRTFLH